MAATDARLTAKRATALRVIFPILDADGDLVTGATGLDSEVSKDQGTFADCTNEAVEIATASGIYYLDLTLTEMTADCSVVQVKTSSLGAKTTVLILYTNGVHVATDGLDSNAITDAAFAGLGLEVGNYLLDADPADHDIVDTIGELINDIQSSDDLTTLLGYTTGVSQGGGAANAVVLAAGASAVNDAYNGLILTILAGTGAGQTQTVVDYVGSTRTATFALNWSTPTDTTSAYAIFRN
jgi:hypothetical protein